MQLNLLVLRSPNPEKLASFYTLLGLNFDYHQHGSGPMHYSAEVSGVVLEIYPLLPDQQGADAGLRLGFAVENLDECFAALLAGEVTYVAKPKQMPWGYRCVIKDADGRRIELTQTP